MKKYILLFFYISRVLSENLTINNENSGRFSRSISCGVVTKSGGFIVGGDKDVKKGDYPWSAVLLNSLTRIYFCGGSVISSKRILTAAHCIYNKNNRKLLAREVQIMVGMHSLDEIYESGRQLLDCDEIFVHPRWHPFTKRFDADIAVLQTEELISFNRHVTPICLSETQLNLNRFKGIVVGYGQSEDKTKLFEGIPSKIELPTISYEQCIARDPKFNEIASKNTFCAGLGDRRGVCQGDSGSGMIFQQSNRFYVFGIVSSSFLNNAGFCDTTKFTVFTNVFNYLDWIKNPSNEEQTKFFEQDLRTCKNGQKIPFYLTCDGTFDCADKSDESRCVEGRIVNFDGDSHDLQKLLTFSPLANTKIDDENFEISTRYNEKVERFSLDFYDKDRNLLIKFLPANLSKKLPNLIEILIRRCSIKKIEKNSFKGLHELKILDIQANNIEEIEEGSFDELTPLDELILDENKLKFLSSNIFDNLENLKLLSLYANNFGTFQDNLFSKLRNLKTLSLDKTGLKDLRENLFRNLIKLEELRLGENFLSFLPPKVFWTLSELRIILIGDNQLKLLPEKVFERNKKLEYISLLNNRLEKIPKNIFDALSGIKSIDLRGNKCNNKNYYDAFFKAQLKIDLQSRC